MSPVLMPDTSQAEDMDPSVANTYRGTVLKIEGQLSQQKKVPQAVITIQLTGVPREDNQQPRDIKRMTWLNIEGAGSMGFDQFLRAIGEKDLADRLRQGEKVPINTDDYIGRPVNTVLKVGTYQDRRRDEIAGFIPV